MSDMALNPSVPELPEAATADTAAPPNETEPIVGPEPTIRIVAKHPLALRWMHWINFPVLFTMIWSGLLIYWADSIPYQGHSSEVYRIGFGQHTWVRLFPPWFWKKLGAEFQLPTGLGYHFFFMWIFGINGLIYVLYMAISGAWRDLLPDRNSLREAWQVTLHDLHLRKEPPPQRKYNGAQKIAYTAVLLMGAASLLTGLAIYKPTTLHWITTLMGGYEMARWLHFWLTMGFCVFFVIHVLQVARVGWNNFRGMVTGYEIAPVKDDGVVE